MRCDLKLLVLALLTLACRDVVGSCERPLPSHVMACDGM